MLHWRTVVCVPGMTDIRVPRVGAAWIVPEVAGVIARIPRVVTQVYVPGVAAPEVRVASVRNTMPNVSVPNVGVADVGMADVA